MSEQTISNLRNAAQFKKVRTPSGKVAFEAYCAVWNKASEVAICSPTLEKLEEAWSEITGHELNREQAQFVWIVKAEK